MSRAPDTMTREELEEEVAYLRSEMGLANTAAAVAAVKAATGLQDGAVRALLALYAAKGRPLAKYQILEAIPAQRGHDDRDPKLADVWVNHIRRATSHGVVNTLWGHGHSISPAGVALVDKALSDAGVTL